MAGSSPSLNDPFLRDPMSSSENVSQLLVKWGEGDKAALDKLMPLVYSELRRLAKQRLAQEKPGQTLEATRGHLITLNTKKETPSDRFFQLGCHILLGMSG